MSEGANRGLHGGVAHHKRRQDRPGPLDLAGLAAGLDSMWIGIRRGRGAVIDDGVAEIFLTAPLSLEGLRTPAADGRLHRISDPAGPGRATRSAVIWRPTETRCVRRTICHYRPINQSIDP